MLFSRPSYLYKQSDASSSTATLETLPYELLEQIFRHACTDGGRTGCSLSLVSKRIRALSRSSRFHSVALLSGTTSQLSCFSHALEHARKEAATAGEATPRVRHLCIRITAAEGGFIPHGPYFAPCPLDLKPEPGDLGRKDPLPHAERRVVSAEARAAYQAEIDKLFTSIGTADLETLCAFQNGRKFSMDEDMPSKIACPDGFRRLRELTLHPADAPVFVPGAGGEGQLEGEPFYPALQRLHIRSDTDATIDFAWWATNAPALEHLRIVCDGSAGKGPKFMPSLLRAIYRTPYNPALSLPTAHKTPSAAASPTLWRKLHRVQILHRAHIPDDDDDDDAFFGPGTAAAAHAASAALTAALRRAFAHVHPLVEFAADYRLQDVTPDGLGGRRGEGRLIYRMPDVFEPDVVRRDWVLRVGGRAGAYDPDCWVGGALRVPRDTLGRRVWAFLGDERVRNAMVAVYILWIAYTTWPPVARLMGFV
ncbi:hypothetical protein C8Q73DRAFT_668221 [Cubamyces lactineus]|nr:hypothetical protein C8Q73DRAFT_668221 [Cubamyces lactineus]